jgi:hypothetical protein
MQKKKRDLCFLKKTLPIKSSPISGTHWCGGRMYVSLVVGLVMLLLLLLLLWMWLVRHLTLTLMVMALTNMMTLQWRLDLSATTVWRRDPCTSDILCTRSSCCRGLPALSIPKRYEHISPILCIEFGSMLRGG